MKNRLKGLLALMLSLVMVFATATSAWADIATSVFLGNVMLEEGKNYWVNGADEATATADPNGYNAYFNNGVLELNGANIAASDNALYAYGDLTINLIGENNTVSTTDATGSGGVAAVYVDGDLTIEGDGALTASAEGQNSDGIYAAGDLTITGENTTVTAIGTYSGSYGIIAFDGDITIEDAAVYANTNAAGDYEGDYGDYGIAADGGSITITDATVDAKGGSYGINAYTTLTITGENTTVTAEGGYNGITAYNDITIEDATVEAEGDVAIYTEDGDITITDANVTAIGEDCGIEAHDMDYEGDADDGDRGNITISGDSANVTAEGSVAGLMAHHTVSITGGIVTAEGTGYGIHGADKVSITGGTVTAKAGDAGGVGIATRYVNNTEENPDTSSVIHISGEDTSVTVGCATGLSASSVEIMNNCEVSITTETTNPAGSTGAINCSTLTLSEADAQQPYWYQWKINDDDMNISSEETQLTVSAAKAATTLLIAPTEEPQPTPDETPEEPQPTPDEAPEEPQPKPEETPEEPRPPIKHYPIVIAPVEETTKVEPAKTFDGGIALYVGMTVLALTGSAWLGKKED